MLSSLDIGTAKPILDPESNVKFMESIINVRLPKFITSFSKTEAAKLIQKRNTYFENN